MTAVFADTLHWQINYDKLMMSKVHLNSRDICTKLRTAYIILKNILCIMMTEARTIHFNAIMAHGSMPVFHTLTQVASISKQQWRKYSSDINFHLHLYDTSSNDSYKLFTLYILC